MEQKTIVRAMQAEDMAIVLDIQSCCYDETKLESRQSFLAKLEASPTTCFIALVAGNPAGYLVAVPDKAGSPPPLHSLNYSVPPDANALYLHDLAVHPEARGAGVGVALIEAYFQAIKQSKAQFACLTSVNDSSFFWERYGFQRAALANSDSGDIATYGKGAQYMSMRVSESDSSMESDSMDISRMAAPHPLLPR
ncbi:GNAT family acetyltransferase [Novimethylophilus kurashikiensis]|uniref:GNAT family acetyltransferase n=1 Tax=Novimethylophilus kurashikiensis TaxID=1825523 RepID=A0A2R5FJQ9_9PROT|nr:GNAT family N-acetyltransferase [Novimethylophilus kurashikiensis]GBG16011.1 GNAT family acetyltransferase [Novimethylophilus kurashikiensis]